ncbi:MAG: chaperone NapD [Gammaproteobacteria bacterium]|nr:chaperone NapD [Gammaproteobacteria bacterium]
MQSKPGRRNFLRLCAIPTARDSQTPGIYVAGLVVHTRPENLDPVRAGLARLSGVEVHAVDPKGKLVVTVEAPSDGVIAGLLNRIPELPGVIACTLAHHHSEDGVGTGA